MLGDETRFWQACTVIFGLFAILKGLHKPSFWAATQAQLDYSHGLIKRGMLGTIYGALGVHHYRPLSAIFFAELLVFFGVLTIFTRRSGLSRRFGSPAVVTVFASSYAITFLTHIVGYTDIVNATVAMLLLLVREPHRRCLLALPLLPFALLVHENFLLLFLPVVLLSFYIDLCTAPDASSRRAALRFGVLLAVLALVMAFATSLRPSMTPSQIAQMRVEIGARVDFPLREDFFPLLAASLGENVRTMLAMFLHMRFWWWMLSISLALLAPLAWALAHFTRRLVREGIEVSGADTPRLMAVTMLVMVAPLGMHLLGWDQVRWNVLCVFGGYLTLTTLSLHAPAERTLRLSTWERNAMIALVALNMASGWGLFNANQITPYPFYPELKHYEVDPRLARVGPERRPRCVTVAVRGPVSRRAALPYGSL